MKERPGVILEKRLAEHPGEWVTIEHLDAALIAAGRQNAVKKTGAYLGDITRYGSSIIQRGYIGSTLKAARIINGTLQMSDPVYRVVTDQRHQQVHYYQWGIYKIVNTVTGDFYIGQARPFGRRWRTHINSLEKCRHHCERLQDDWCKYGAYNFEFKVLVVTPPGDLQLLDLYESAVIATFQPYYNTRSTRHSAEHHPKGRTAQTRADELEAAEAMSVSELRSEIAKLQAALARRTEVASPD